MNTYMGSAKYEYVTSLRSSWTTSNLSSALYTDSMLPLESRLRNFILTTAELRPDLLYSAFCTTMASLPIITTVPVRSSCAIFIKLSCAKKVAQCCSTTCDASGSQPTGPAAVIGGYTLILAELLH